MSKLPEDDQGLRGLLRDAPEIPQGAFNHKVPPTADIHTLALVLDIVKTAIRIRRWSRAQEALLHVPWFESLLAHPRYAGHAPHLAALHRACAEMDVDKANRALARLRRIVRPVAADREIREGQIVRVMRTRHGWYDGHVEGRFARTPDGMTVTDGNGDVYEIEHERDVR
jgi:hypothetical protein